MLDQSTAELTATIDELEKRFDSIENEGISISIYIQNLSLSYVPLKLLIHIKMYPKCFLNNHNPIQVFVL